jgi:hypothetical protein
VASCLSCEELEQKICDLSEEITVASCTASITKEGDTSEDRTPGLKAKIEVLKTYTDLYKAKKCGSSTDLFEFVHVPCVTPVSCIGDVCISTPTIRRNRRYRR